MSARATYSQDDEHYVLEALLGLIKCCLFQRFGLAVVLAFLETLSCCLFLPFSSLCHNCRHLTFLRHPLPEFRLHLRETHYPQPEHVNLLSSISRI